MKSEKYEIVMLPEESASGSTAAYEQVCRYLLQRYSEGCEENEGFSIFEGVNGGASGKRLFNTGTENGRHE